MLCVAAGRERVSRVVVAGPVRCRWAGAGPAVHLSSGLWGSAREAPGSGRCGTSAVGVPRCLLVRGFRADRRPSRRVEVVRRVVGGGRDGRGGRVGRGRGGGVGVASRAAGAGCAGPGWGAAWAARAGRCEWPAPARSGRRVVAGRVVAGRVVGGGAAEAGGSRRATDVPARGPGTAIGPRPARDRTATTPSSPITPDLTAQDLDIRDVDPARLRSATRTGSAG